MTESLYERLGGAERIAAVIDDAIDRHAVNPVLAPRFANKDLPRLKEIGTQLLCAGVGGPQRYDGRAPGAADAGMNVSEREFLSLVDDIVAALNAHGVAQAEVDEVVAILFSLKGEVLRV
ncbi:MAG: group I truncated hemoglobin [Burkholderiaceae bacterium]